MKLNNTNSFLFSIVFFLLTNSLSAQYDPVPQGYTNPVPPSPNVAAISKYGDIPIGQYTGIPDISVSLFNMKVKELSFPVTASYNASGIKVSEEASFMGLGWSLNAGGMINQVISGQNDFLLNGYYGSDQLDPVTIGFCLPTFLVTLEHGPMDQVSIMR